MFCRRQTHRLIKGSAGRLVAGIVLTAVAAFGCGGRGRLAGPPRPDYTDRTDDLRSLARWFAPILYLHPDEPFDIVAVIPVFNPRRPIVAYHVFFEDDAMLAGRGKEVDHEVVWVEYDPLSLKVVDVPTLWHRTVLRTDTCALDVESPGQRPRICVQWGQHGMLPLGWEILVSARPRLELIMHYNLIRYINRIPIVSPEEPTIAFSGSYEDYLTFTRRTDTLPYVEAQDIITAEDCADALRLRIGKSFYFKKQWPDW
jgi:hypothetical protein